MDNKIGATLEMLEEKIESIKWLVITSFPAKKSGISNVVHLIRKSAGILAIPKGTIVENELRRKWETNSLRRTT